MIGDRRLALLTGGQSPEHAVSLSSARNLWNVLQDAGISTTVIVITTEGLWLNEHESEAALHQLYARSGGRRFLECHELLSSHDIVFPLIHGATGEDGVVQGFLQMLQIPYIGCSVASSAVCLDKAIFKNLLTAKGLPQTRYRVCSFKQFETDRQTCVEDITQALSIPWIVKPASLGSSIGVSTADARTDLERAIRDAFRHDQKVVIEEVLSQYWEIEVGVIGNGYPRTSVCGRVDHGERGFYDHGKKYTESVSRLYIPADIPDDVAGTCQELAVQVYKIFGCAGLARVDFLCPRGSKTPYINEVNTMPGFTATSMFAKLWEASGVPIVGLVNELVGLAWEQYEHRRTAC